MKSASSKIDSDSDLVKEWYNLAIENAPDMVFIHNSEGRITYVNETGIKESGYSEDELLHMNPVQLVPPEYYKKLEEIQVKRLSGNMEVFVYEMEYLKKNGGRIQVRVSSSPILKDGRLDGVIHIMRNISDIRKTESFLLTQSELNSKLSQENNLDQALEDVMNTALLLDDVDCGGIYIYDEDKNEYQLKIHRNLSKEYAETFYSFSNDSINAEIVKRGKPLFLNQSEYPEELGKEVINLLLNKEKIKSIALIPFFYKNIPIGTLSLGSHNMVQISDNSKKMLVLLSQKIGGAISRIKAEKSLKESEAKYRQLVESANSIISVFDNNGKILSMNEYGTSFFGYTKGEIVGKNVYETITPEFESTGRDLRNLVNDIHTNSKEFGIHINENIKKNGEKVWIHWGNKPIYNEKGDLISILSIGNDITENRKLEEKIKYSEMKFKALFENAQESILILNNDFMVVDANKATINLLGYTKEKLLGNMNIFDITSPLETNRLQHILFKEFDTSGLSIETHFIKSSGNVSPVEVSLSKIEVKGEKSIICLIRDISEQRKKEDDLKKQLLKYDLEDGNLYLSKGPSESLPFDAFRELVDIGYKGIIISRENKDYFDFEDINFDYYWISKRDGPKSLSPDLSKLKEFISNINYKSVLFLDSIDYLVINNGFNELYEFINELRELAYFGKNIIILSVDKNTFDTKQLKLLEKETKPIELKISESINRKLLDIIYYILNQNKLGINPSYSSMGKELSMTRPTVRKNIRYLEANGYVIVHRKGRNKKLEITEKGKKLL